MGVIFQVYVERTGRKVCEGPARQCGEAIGVTDGAIREAEKGGYLSQGIYRIVRRADECDDDQKKVDKWSLKEAAENWDKFCEPIRKKYGIPVYRAKPEVRG